MKIFQIDCIRGAQFHEGCRLKEYLHRPNDLFCLPANHLLHWKSIYIKANQNVVGLQSTSLFFHFFKMLYWDLAQMKLFFLKSYDRNINQSSFMNRKMISIDETFPVDGDFMLFLLISGVGCWIWVFVEGTLFVHVNLFHLLFSAALLLINGGAGAPPCTTIPPSNSPPVVELPKNEVG